MMYLHTNFFTTDRKFPSKILFKETEPMKIASYEAYLLGKGFTYKEVKC